MSVGTPGPGQIVRSIHKSGYAFDMCMFNYQAPFHECPLYYTRVAPYTDAQKWMVYALVENSQRPYGPHESHVEYVDDIKYWIYDPNSPEGGREVALGADEAAAALAAAPRPDKHNPNALLERYAKTIRPPGMKPKYSFLNFTKVAEHFGLMRISAHSTGWKQLPAVVIQLNTTNDLRQLLGPLKLQASQDPNSTVTVNGKTYAIGDWADALKFLRSWLDAAASLGPTPDVTVQAWTKPGYALLRRLMTKPFWGRKVLETEEGEKTGSEIELNGKYNFKGGLYPFTLRPITAPVTLQPEDKFEIPAAPGVPNHMEWWHFQYPGTSQPKTGVQGRTWGGILGDVGCTEEGLLGKSGNRSIYGHFGLGYTEEDLSAEAH